jgi:hypothetical protein
MSEFTTDNTWGLSADQLAAMNDEFLHELQRAFADLPDGVEGASYDLVQQIRKSTAEAVLKRHGGA